MRFGTKRNIFSLDSTLACRGAVAFPLLLDFPLPFIALVVADMLCFWCLCVVLLVCG